MNDKTEVAITSAEESARVAKLTSEAIKASGEKVVDDIKNTIEALERTASILRLQADNLSEEIRRHSAKFADNVSSYVNNCHGAVKMFRDYQAKIGDMPNGIMNFKLVDSEELPETEEEWKRSNLSKLNERRPGDERTDLSRSF